MDFKKKGQMEMVGLVIIVILITLGMLFLAQFALKDQPEKKIFTRKGLASSTMSTILKTTIVDPNCLGDNSGNQPQIGRDLFKDCAENYDSYKDRVSDEFFEEGYSTYSCNNKHSCAFLQGMISGLLSETLGAWGKHYEFKSTLVSMGERSDILVEIPRGGGKSCQGEKDSSGMFPLNTEAGIVESVLYLCD